jgi:hypothetical protein
MGYFNKIARSDMFVFLNQVDYEKSGHSMQCYTNRVGILENSQKLWIHCPVVREHGAQPICNVKINNQHDWKNELKSKIESCYGNSQYYDEVSGYVFRLVDTEADNISEYNIAIISDFCRKFGLNTKMIRQDELNTDKHSTELLIQITKAVGCDTYMYGGGGSKYQEEQLFDDVGIKLMSQDYIMPEYNQPSEKFVYGLSILDTLFCCGYDKTAELIRK